MRPSGFSAVVNRVAGVLLVALLVASCSGDGTRPSTSPTRTPTAGVPSTSEPTSAPDTEEPTSAPTTEPTSAPTTEPTSAPTTEPTSEEALPELPSPTRTPERPEKPETPLTSTATSTSTPTATPTATPTTTALEQSVTATASETVTPSPGAQELEAEPVEEEDVSAWVWWLAGALLLSSLVAIPLVVRSRRRNAWDQDLAAAEGEIAWLARELLPELRRTASREELAAGWTVSQARVSAAEDRLTVLESAGPDEPRRTRARVLRDASRAARVQLQRLLGPKPCDTWALDLDAIIIDLETALRPTRATSPT